MIVQGQVYWNPRLRAHGVVYDRDDLPNGYSEAEIMIIHTSQPVCRRTKWRKVPRGWELFREAS